MKAAAFVGLLLLVADSATAQPPPESFTRPLIVYTAVAAADVATSAWCFRQPGCVETNPAANWLGSDDQMLVVASAIDAAAVWTLHRTMKDKHPKLLRIGLYSVAALRAAIVVNNVHQAILHGRPVPRFIPTKPPTF